MMEKSAYLKDTDRRWNQEYTKCFQRRQSWFNRHIAWVDPSVRPIIPHMPKGYIPWLSYMALCFPIREHTKITSMEVKENELEAHVPSNSPQVVLSFLRTNFFFFFKEKSCGGNEWISPRQWPKGWAWHFGMDFSSPLILTIEVVAFSEYSKLWILSNRGWKWKHRTRFFLV